MKTVYKIFMVLTLVFLSSCFSQGRKASFNNAGDESSQSGLQIFLQSNGLEVTLCDNLITEDCHLIVDCQSATQYVLGYDIGGNQYCLLYVDSSSSFEECSNNSECDNNEECVDGVCLAIISLGDCVHNDDCEAGETCSGGTCISSGGGNYQQLCIPACGAGLECENGSCVSVCDTGYVWDYVNETCVSNSAPVQTNIISLSSDLNGDFITLFNIDEISNNFHYSNTTTSGLSTDQLNKLKRFRTFSFFAQDFKYHSAYNDYPYGSIYNQDSLLKPFFIYDQSYLSSVGNAMSKVASPSQSSNVNYDKISYKINANLLIDSDGIIQQDYNNTVLSITIKFQSDYGLEKTYDFVPSSYDQITNNSFSITFAGDCVNELIFEGSIVKSGGKHKIVVSKLAFKKKRDNFDVPSCFFSTPQYYNPSLEDLDDLNNWSDYIEEGSDCDHNIAMPDDFNSLDFNSMNVIGSQGYMNLLDTTIAAANRTIYEPGFVEGSTGTQGEAGREF
jgi:hypothetical protein